jgi:hypothetical protein
VGLLIGLGAVGLGLWRLTGFVRKARAALRLVGAQVIATEERP